MPRQLLLEFERPAPTFDNFFAGPNARIVAVLRDGHEQFVYLWGAAGSGRTHLLRAMRALDAEVVTIDDVNGLDAPAQLDLFTQFIDAARTGRRLVCAGNAAPAQLALREDLRTRLGQGVVAQLLALDDDARLAALDAHARNRGLGGIAPDVLRYIASRAARDMGTQMAVLDALERRAAEEHRPITVALAREALHQLPL